MIGRRRLPLLAELGGGGRGGRSWALGRGDLDALRGLLGRLEDKQVILVSGGERGVGAVATGLAATATAAGRRVALVECEVGRPRMAAALGLVASPGLREYLEERAEAGQVLQSLVPAGPASAKAQEPLVCIVAGEGGEGQAETLDSDGFRHVAAKLRSGYETVILAGPWLDDEAALAVVSGVADTALVCVPPDGLSGRSGRAVRAAARRLACPLAGVVAVGD